MKGMFFSSGWEVLDSPEAVRFMVTPATQRYAVPFMGHERSVAEVARELGVDAGSVLYRVRQMLRLGLLKLTRRAARAGRPVAYYQSVSRGFFAPFHLTDAASLDELMRESRTDSQAVLERSVRAAWQRLGGQGEWGIYVFLDEAGRLNRDFVPSSIEGRNRPFWEAVTHPDAPPVWDQFAVLNLPEAAAKQLQQELAGLVYRYAKLQDDAQNSYILRLAIAPVEP